MKKDLKMPNLRSLRGLSAAQVLMDPKHVDILPQSMQHNIISRAKLNNITKADEFKKQNRILLTDPHNPSYYISEYAEKVISLLNDGFFEKDIPELNQIMRTFGKTISISNISKMRKGPDGRVNNTDLIRFLHQHRILHALGIEGVADTLCGQYVLLYSHDPDGDAGSISRSVENADIPEVQDTIGNGLFGTQYVANWINKESIKELQQPGFTKQIQAVIFFKKKPELLSKELIDAAILNTQMIRSRADNVYNKRGEYSIPLSKLHQLFDILELSLRSPIVNENDKEIIHSCIKKIEDILERYAIADLERQSHARQLQNQRNNHSKVHRVVDNIRV